jgi:hypothetical protein
MLKMFRVDTNSDNMVALRKARSLKDVATIIEKIKRDLLLISKHTIHLEKSVSSVLKLSIYAAETIELGDLVRDKTSKGTKPYGVIEDYTPPNTKDLVKNSQELNRLAQRIAELESAKQVILSDSFSAYPDLQRKTIKSVNDLVKVAAKDRDKQVRAMSKIGRETKPKEHVKFVKIMQSHIKQVLSEENYSDISTNMFVLNPVKDQVWYQTFIKIRDLINDDGYEYEFYSVVVTAIVDLNTGEFKHSITTINMSRIPGSFDPGKEATTTVDAKRRVSRFFTGDNFVAKHGRKNLKGFPLKNTRDFRQSSLPNASEHIDGVRVQNGKIYARLEKGLTDTASIKEAVEDARSILSILVRRKEVTVGSKKYDRYLKDAITHKIVTGKNRRKWIEFAIIPSERITKGDLTPKIIDDTIARMIHMDGITTDDARRASQALKKEFS